MSSLLFLYRFVCKGQPSKSNVLLHCFFQFGQFASDLGGVVGLWVGASVITCFEYIEYILDILVLWISKSNNKNTRSKIDNSFSGNNTINKMGTVSAFDGESKS